MKKKKKKRLLSQFYLKNSNPFLISHLLTKENTWLYNGPDHAYHSQIDSLLYKPYRVWRGRTGTEKKNTQQTGYICVEGGSFFFFFNTRESSLSPGASLLHISMNANKFCIVSTHLQESIIKVKFLYMDIDIIIFFYCKRYTYWDVNTTGDWSNYTIVYLDDSILLLKNIFSRKFEK